MNLNHIFFIFVIIAYYWPRTWAMSWARHFDPNDKSVVIDEKKYPYKLKKHLLSWDKHLNVALTNSQFKVSQYGYHDPFQYGYTRNMHRGKYHWVVCDNVLFSYLDKVTRVGVDPPYPQFYKAIGKIYFSTDDETWWEEGLLTLIRWGECCAFLGDVVKDTTYYQKLAYQLQSSAMCFAPAKDILLSSPYDIEETIFFEQTHDQIPIEEQVIPDISKIYEDPEETRFKWPKDPKLVEKILTGSRDDRWD